MGWFCYDWVMAQKQNLPMATLVPWIVVGCAVFSALFGGLITLTSNYTFLGASMFIFAVLMVIMVPTVIWLGVIEPLVWDKLSDRSQETVRNWGIGLFLLALFVLAPLGMFGGDSWSGDGEVNLFPEGATSKNYRLDAKIDVTSKWWRKKDYKIDSVVWPESGTTYFSDCIINDSNTTCTDNEGHTWRVEIATVPDKPSRGE